MAQASAKVLVLFSFAEHPKGYYNLLFDRLAAKAAKHGLELSRGSLKDLQVSIKNGQLAITESRTGLELDQFKAVYFELWSKAPQQALAAATYLEQLGIPYFSPEISRILPTTKIGELAQLAGKVPIPDSFTTSRRQFKTIFNDSPKFTYPFILKNVEGFGGKLNFLVKDYQELVAILDEHKDVTFVAQEFIPNTHDYRFIVLGGEVKLVIKRQRNGDTHLNNTSRGAEGTLVAVSEFDSATINLALEAARAVGREEFAGVDLLFNSDTNQPYILEVNKTPQIEIGSNIDAKMEALCKFIASKIKEQS